MYCHKHTRRPKRALFCFNSSRSAPECAIIGTQYDQVERCVVLSKATAQPRSLKVSIQQQQHSSSSSKAVDRQLCFKLLPVVTGYVLLVHSSRRSNHDTVFSSNAMIKHTSSDLIPLIMRIIQEQQKIHMTVTPVFPLFDLRRPREIK